MVVEDQTHFLLFCPTLQDTRVQLYTKLLTKFPSFMSDSISDRMVTLLNPQVHLYCITMAIYELYMARQKLFVTDKHNFFF